LGEQSGLHSLSAKEESVMTESSPRGETGKVESQTSQLVVQPPSLLITALVFLITGLALLFFSVAFAASVSRTLGPLQIIPPVVGGLLVAAAIVFEVMRFRRQGVMRTPFISNPDDLGLAVEQLAQNYELSRAQTNSAFTLSAIFMGAGLLVILLGAIRILFGQTDNANTLSIVAGVISEAISGGALALYRSNFERLNETSSRLYETWKVLVAYKLSKDLPDLERGAAVLGLIRALTGAPVKTLEH
jgi:hypothetical protein